MPLNLQSYVSVLPGGVIVWGAYPLASEGRTMCLTMMAASADAYPIQPFLHRRVRGKPITVVADISYLRKIVCQSSAFLSHDKPPQRPDRAANRKDSSNYMCSPCRVTAQLVRITAKS